MAVTPSTRSHLDDHLSQAEFALKVASNFDCLKGTPAHEAVRAALARVAEALGWVREKLAAEPMTMRPFELPLGKGLPLTRHARMGHRWP